MSLINQNKYPFLQKEYMLSLDLFTCQYRVNVMNFFKNYIGYLFTIFVFVINAALLHQAKIVTSALIPYNDTVVTMPKYREFVTIWSHDQI